VLASGGTITQQTMLWDANRGEVRPARSKEGSHDYRYFPEPDLPPLQLARAWIDQARVALPELPAAKRTRFATEIIQAVRQAVGPGFPIGLRLSQWKLQDYTAKLATTPAEMEAWLAPLVQAGVDIFHCSQRRFWEPEFPGSDLNFAGWAKKLTGKTTITVGSIGLSGEFLGAFRGEASTPSSLDELLRRFDRGDFDLVAVGRALLADGEWARKIDEGRASELRGFAQEALATLA